MEIYGNVTKEVLVLEPAMHYKLNWVFDLETYATCRNAIVPEVSGVAFDILTGNTVHEFSFHIDIDSQVKLGREVSASTLTFWMQQENNARDKMLLADPQYCARYGYPKPLQVKEAIAELSKRVVSVSADWGTREGKSKEPLVWGNGISFDLGKIESLCESVGMEVPWMFWNERDARTLMDLCPGIKSAFASDFRGTPHYGLDDCKHEVRYLSAAYNKILELNK